MQYSSALKIALSVRSNSVRMSQECSHMPYSITALLATGASFTLLQRQCFVIHLHLEFRI